MKKIISIILVALVITAAFAGCTDNSGSQSKKMSIVTTIFPEYDWVMNILGDKKNEVDVTMLLDSGVDLHSYQPTADDIIKISSCDLFIYVGGESDEWVDDALKESVNKNMTVLNLLDVLGDAAKEEEVKEGMQAEEHDHEHDEDEHDHEEEAEYDEHIWLSLKNASVLADAIAQAIEKIDAANADTYAQNAKSYIDRINALDAEYKTAVDGAGVKTVIFADRFPFRYLVDDYGLDYYAAFVGCSAESEASFETISFLAAKADETGTSSILTLEGTQHNIAQTVKATAKNKNLEILSMNSMQSTTAEDVKNGANYLLIMEKNLQVLRDALK